MSQLNTPEQSGSYFQADDKWTLSPLLHVSPPLAMPTNVDAETQGAYENTAPPCGKLTVLLISRG